jgi:hypothetical protein
MISQRRIEDWMLIACSWIYGDLRKLQKKKKKHCHRFTAFFPM